MRPRSVPAIPPSLFTPLLTSLTSTFHASQVVASMLQRAEMRPIVEYLGFKQVAASDSIMVNSAADFIADHLSSGGTRRTEQQMAHELLVKALSSSELLEDGLVTEAARRIGVRPATFRHLLDCRVKMDAEQEDCVAVGALLKVSRLRRKDAADDEAKLFEDWSHVACRYDSTQTTAGKKVRRFDDEKTDGRIKFEEHERRTLPCSRLELCQRFLRSDDYKAFFERKASEGKELKPLHVSFFQKRICSCMVDEKMTQCADSIDTQFNVLFATWVKSVQTWYESETCSKRDCVCKEEGFFEIKTRQDLWDFIFRGECAPQPDPTRRLPRDAAEHLQLDYGCVAAECNKKGCLKDKLARWKLCPVQNRLGSATEMSYRKWTPVPRGGAKVRALSLALPRGWHRRVWHSLCVTCAGTPHAPSALLSRSYG